MDLSWENSGIIVVNNGKRATKAVTGGISPGFPQRE